MGSTDNYYFYWFQTQDQDQNDCKNECNLLHLLNRKYRTEFLFSWMCYSTAMHWFLTTHNKIVMYIAGGRLTGFIVNHPDHPGFSWKLNSCFAWQSLTTEGEPLAYTGCHDSGQYVQSALKVALCHWTWKWPCATESNRGWPWCHLRLTESGPDATWW